MKNFFFVSLFAIALIFTSCGKYEEGPSLSLLSKKARVAGDWVYDKILLNGAEVTIDEETNTMVSSLKKDGTGTTTYTDNGATITLDVEWKFNDDKTKFTTRSKLAGTSTWGDWDDEAEIIRLTNKEFWTKESTTTAGFTFTYEVRYKAK